MTFLFRLFRKSFLDAVVKKTKSKEFWAFVARLAGDVLDDKVDELVALERLVEELLK